MTPHQLRKDHLHFITDKAIQAVSPDPAMRAALTLDGDLLTVDGKQYDLSKYNRILAIGAGKASAAMAATLEDLLGERLHSGVVVTKYGHGLELARTRVLESNHPVPDQAGADASQEILKVAEAATENDLVFCLLSGGASALMPSPRHPVTLEDKQAATHSLLCCGATINEINAIRKHLSAMKGGHLAKTLEPATVVTLIISDVVGDYLDVIGSGPTAPDESTFLDCRATLDRYRLCGKVPAVVEQMIFKGCKGDAPETRKADDACFHKVQNVIIAGNSMALDGAALGARELGYTPMVLDRAMMGEAREVAAKMVAKAKEICESGGPDNPICLLAGGETTVTINGTGKGGRNQEFALAAGVELHHAHICRDRVSLVSIGTDGTDGPTDAAGGLILPGLVTAENLDKAMSHLTDNNAYPFLDAMGGLLKTGPTRTNVMDIVAVLVEPDRPTTD